MADKSPHPKHIFVTGGVVSSLGKGITAASIGLLLKLRGLKVTMQKLDPYINVDPGTMNPFQHGEVFVTDDGTETDLDLGHYERFVDVNLQRESNVTTGTVYGTIISRERKGEFLGATVQVIPHITDEIKRRILELGREDDVDVTISEIGGTVGDIESQPFLEAIRQLKKDIGHENVFYIHVTLVPYLETSRELKTKPTQHSVKELKSLGIQPDAIVCRSDRPINDGVKDKISLFCDTDREAVVSAVNASSIYEVPLMLNLEGLDEYIVDHLGLAGKPPDLSEWKGLVERIKSLEGEVRIAVVGKYVDLPDAYISIAESLTAAGIKYGVNVKMVWVASDRLKEEGCDQILGDVHGILVPGGFGIRGIEGKIMATQFAREKGIPFLGICLGLQCAVIEFARDVGGMESANSAEFDPETPYPVIDLMAHQKEVDGLGGTMRLGLYPCKLMKGTRAHEAYGEEVIYERHRHRYEVSNSLRNKLEEAGLSFSGVSPDGRLVEIIEIPEHPWFVACQFHPEFKSRPLRPHPLFREFVRESIERQRLSGSNPTVREGNEARELK
ncbi:MAG: CTP synthase [Actinobacteria bacterium]|nr:CTP synthase [Actinomycetota bacterium]MCG2819924.1 CTP synthase [Actinomycetes bacterium]MBU4218987.1 CTP synthase [Actinomycetota bacterium]MBU4359175.1 CTP synthase [Actinomycetota bacterium]MBU4391490.1 CTP synthase [Actinomycetota bacterium]